MFCPNCGKECEEGSRFCLHCGVKLDDAAPRVNPAADNNLYSNMNNEPQFSPIVSAGGTATVRSAGSGVKKILVISLIALVVVALGIGIFFFVRNKLAHDNIVNNPTKYVFSSYGNYFDEAGAQDEIYNAVKGALKTGTVKLSADASIPALGNQNLSAAVQVAYDKENKKYYLLADGSGLAPLLAATGVSSGNNKLELYTDSKRLDFDLDVLGKQAKYFVDFGKLKEQAENSIFSPDKENVLNITKEQFNEFLETFEKSYHSMVEAQGTSDAAFDYEEFIKKFEKAGVVTVEDGSVKVGDETKSVDVITYTFDYNAISTLLKDMKEEFISMMEKSGIDKTGGNLDDIKKSYDDMVDGFNKNANKDIKIVVKFNVEKGSSKLVKFEATADNFADSDAKVNSLSCVIDYITKPDMCIKFEIKGGDETVTGRVYREIKGSKTTYGAEVNPPASSNSEKIDVTLVFDKDAKTFTFTSGETSISGTAEVKDNTLIIGYDFDLSQIPNIGQGNIKLSLEISSTPKMNTIDAEKNIFSITEDEFKSLADSPMGNVVPDDYTPYEDDYDPYDDYDPEDAA